MRHLLSLRHAAASRHARLDDFKAGRIVQPANASVRPAPRLSPSSINAVGLAHRTGVEV